MRLLPPPRVAIAAAHASTWLDEDLRDALETPEEHPIATCLAMGRLARSGLGGRTVYQSVRDWSSGFDAEAAATLGSHATAEGTMLLEDLRDHCDARPSVARALAHAFGTPETPGAVRSATVHTSAILANCDDVTSYWVLLRMVMNTAPSSVASVAAMWQQRLRARLDDADRVASAILLELLEGAKPELPDGRWMDYIARVDPSDWWLLAWRRLQSCDARSALPPPIRLSVGNPANDYDVVRLAAQGAAETDPGRSGDVLFSDELVELRLVRVSAPRRRDAAILRLELKSAHVEADFRAPDAVLMKDLSGKVVMADCHPLNRGLFWARLGTERSVWLEIPSLSFSLRIEFPRRRR